MKKLSIKLFQYHFIFSWPSLLFFFITFGFLLSLGGWQLKRAEEKREWLTYRKQQGHKKPIELTPSSTQTLSNYARVKIIGSYLPYPIIFLDNKMYRHQVGYQVLMAFLPEGHKQLVWINRGWIPRGIARNKLPKVEAPSGKWTLTGRVHFPEKSHFSLSKTIENMNETTWRLPFFHLNMVRQISNKPFYPFELLLLTDPAEDASRWIRDWQPKVMVSPERHIGYAVQWFGIALVFLVVFVVFHMKKWENRDS